MRKLTILALTLVPAVALAETSPVFQQVVDDAAVSYQKRECPTVVFDLDGTLLDDRPRTVQILKDFAADRRYVTPAAAAQIQNLTVALVKYRLPDTLAAVGVTDPTVINNAAAFKASAFSVTTT